MSVITIKESGNFKNSESFLKRLLSLDFASKLKEYGAWGVRELYEATPRDTGETARHWRYVIEQSKNRVSISWTNDYAPYFVQVAILIQYGHATKSGGWVDGIDYINPALAPVFAEIEDKLWKEVTKT